MRERTTRLAPVLTLVALAAVASTTFGDIDGNGLDEIGVLGVESAGRARGPWFQSYDGEGRRLMNFFLDADLVEPRALASALDAQRGDEVVVAGRDPEGGAQIQVRSGNGRRLAQAVLEDEALASMRLLEVTTASGNAIALAYSRLDGSGAARLYRYEAGELVPGGAIEIVPAGATGHTWFAEDLDGDGSDELIAGAADEAGFGAWLWTARIDDPGPATSRQAFPPRFHNAAWVVADFRPEAAGLEVVAGAQRRRGGAGKAVLLANDGRQPLRGVSTPRGATSVAWRSLAAPTGGDRLLAGYRTRGGSWEFRIWDPSDGRARSIVTSAALPAGIDVADWIAGDFDGGSGSGEQVVVLYTRSADRAIHYQQWNQEGQLVGAAELLAGEYVAPRAREIRALDENRDDLLVVASAVGAGPRALLWSPPGAGRLLLDLRVLGPDVH